MGFSSKGFLGPSGFKLRFASARGGVAAAAAAAAATAAAVVAAAAAAAVAAIAAAAIEKCAIGKLVPYVAVGLGSGGRCRGLVACDGP